MQNPSNLEPASLPNHLQDCRLHTDARISICHGRLKRGGKCSHKGLESSSPGFLPTCKLHRDQHKKLASCRAPLPCGFECGRICEWRVHGFQLCPEHLRSPMKCYFLNIPIEMRLRIYAYLLPERPIPASWNRNPQRTIHDGKFYTMIFLVNQQVREEAARALYSTRAFTIELGSRGLNMCNTMYYSEGRINTSNHALQDYQMQLMLLEQQNKRRLMMARQEQDNLGGPSTSAFPASTSIRTSTQTVTPPTSVYSSIGPVWNQPLSDRNFNLIQHFIMKIVLCHPNDQPSGGRFGTLEKQQQALESRLYDYCDHIHRFVLRLRLFGRPISRLDVIIEFGRSFDTWDDASAAASILLRPLQRLRNIQRPEILSITMIDAENRESELLNLHRSTLEAGQEFHNYLRVWSADISRKERAPETSPILVAYWQLAKLISSVDDHYRSADPRLQKLAELLHQARIAREAEDGKRFKEAWETVVGVWHEYLHYQQEFQGAVAGAIGRIYDTIDESYENGI